MEHDSTLYVGLDVHKDSITVAYALGTGEVERYCRDKARWRTDGGIVRIAYAASE
ncbi:hypothetical protein PQR02_37095 [Paraburkholderia sediminicola]|uniref:Uncharacterized protein n=1 Tax=Paraburkholderia rhynchosiae TaxID=487049 RepID=A0ACC7NMC7_9BURK